MIAQKNMFSENKLYNKVGLKKYKLIAICGAFLIILLWILWGGTSDYWAIWAGATSIGENSDAVPTKTVAAGAWGDSFGGFNALFAALGFGAVTTTLYLQYEAFQTQVRDQHLQRFEQTFFILLDLMRNLRKDLKYKQTDEMRQAKLVKYSNESQKEGYDAIRYAFYDIRQWVSLRAGSNNDGVTRESIGQEYDRCVHKRYESRFSPYFRIIYTILNKVKNDKMLSESDKAYYGNILRSQLTSYDMMLLAFNGMSVVSKDLSDLIVYFRLLKYVPAGRGRTILEIVYPIEAFSAREDD